MTALVDSDQADTQQTAKPIHAPVPVATAPGFRDRKPKLVGDTQPVDCLERRFKFRPSFISTTTSRAGGPLRTAAMSQPLTSPFTSNPLACRKRLTIG